MQGLVVVQDFKISCCYESLVCYCVRENTASVSGVEVSTHFISVCRKFGAKILRLRRTSVALFRMTEPVAADLLSMLLPEWLFVGLIL